LLQGYTTADPYACYSERLVSSSSRTSQSIQSTTNNGRARINRGNPIAKPMRNPYPTRSASFRTENEGSLHSDWVDRLEEAQRMLESAFEASRSLMPSAGPSMSPAGVVCLQ
jgi:hypothetical protein